MAQLHAGDADRDGIVNPVGGVADFSPLSVSMREGTIAHARPGEPGRLAPVVFPARTDRDDIAIL